MKYVVMKGIMENPHFVLVRSFLFTPTPLKLLLVHRSLDLQKRGKLDFLTKTALCLLCPQVSIQLTHPGYLSLGFCPH